MVRTPRQQRGIVAVLVAIGLLALLAMAGLAIDTGHLVLNKSRLQSTVDAAALAAAKVLDQTGDEDQATDAANSVFAVNANRLNGATNTGIGVQYSSTLYPFVPASTPANYVRVRADNLSWRTGFIRVLGLDTLSTGATAVAGPSAPIGAPCDLVPLGVCSTKDASGPYWGYVPYGQLGNTVTKLKETSQGENPPGAGNFDLLDLNDGSGKKDVRRNLAAGAGCSVRVGEDVPTETGNAPMVRAGLNTRFGPPYLSPFKGTQSIYPPDHVVTPTGSWPLASDGMTITANGTLISGIGDVPYSYRHYLDDYEGENFDFTYSAGGRPQRRIVTVPIIENGDCGIPGKHSVTIVGFGSFFLLQRMCEPSHCPQGTDSWIFGQFLGEGPASGTPGPHGGYGVYKIVLHNDPDSDDS